MSDCTTCFYCDGPQTLKLPSGEGVFQIVFCQFFGGPCLDDCSDWTPKSAPGPIEPGDVVIATGPLEEYYSGPNDTCTKQGTVGTVSSEPLPPDEMPGQVMVDFGGGPVPFVTRWLRKR